MSPQSRNLTVAGVLMVGASALGLYAYFGVMKGEESAQETKAISERIFADHAPGERSPDGGQMAPAEFVALTVTAKGDTTVLEKKADRWQITSPLSTTADAAMVESVTSQLNGAKFKSTVEEKPTDEDLIKYGLKDPKWVVKGTAKTAKGAQQELVLFGGIENTFDGSVYLRKNTDPKVYSAEGAVRLALEKSTFDLRAKEVFSSLEDVQLKRVDFKTKGNSYSLESDGPKKWRVIKPQAIPADTATVIQMLTALKSERALGFPKDTPEVRKQFGLDAPQVDIQLAFASGPAARVAINKATLNGEVHVYALREQGGAALLVEVASSALTDLDKPAAELRDKSVLTIDREAVAKASFVPAGGGTAIVLEKMIADAGQSEEWRVTAPTAGPAKKWKMSSVMWTLTSLKAAEFGPENPKDWAKFGIDSKSRTATLFDSNGREMAKLWVGKDVPGKKNVAYVRGTRPQVLEIDTSRLSELPSQVQDVLDAPAQVTSAPGVADGGTAETIKPPLPN